MVEGDTVAPTIVGSIVLCKEHNGLGKRAVGAVAVRFNEMRRTIARRFVRFLSARLTECFVFLNSNHGLLTGENSNSIAIGWSIKDSNLMVTVNRDPWPNQVMPGVGTRFQWSCAPVAPFKRLKTQPTAKPMAGTCTPPP